MWIIEIKLTKRRFDHRAKYRVRVDSRDLQTSNISIWRYHCLERWHFWRSHINIDYRLIQCVRGFCSSPLPIFKHGLQVHWIDHSSLIQREREYQPADHKVCTGCSAHDTVLPSLLTSNTLYILCTCTFKYTANCSSIDNCIIYQQHCTIRSFGNNEQFL